jgi:hypothetical protein
VGAGVAGALLLGAPRAGRRAALALALAAIPAVLWGAFALRVPLLARLSEGARADVLSLPVRGEIARSALALWRAHPWLGSGPDTFGLVFPGVQTAALWRNAWLGMPVHADSVVLQTLATGGALGVVAGLAWLAAIVLAKAAAWRVRRQRGGEVLDVLAALTGLAVVGAMNPVGIAGAALFVVLSALLVCCGAELHADGMPSGRRRWAAWLAGLAVSVALALASSREMSALAAAGRARDALDRVIVADEASRPSHLDQAVRHARGAAARAPGEDELWRLCCDAELALARDALAHRDSAAAASAASSAEVAAHRALGLEPQRAANLQRLGNALALRARLGPGGGSSGDAGTLAARRAEPSADRVDSVFAEALRHAPVDGLILVDQARAQLELHQPERALITARRIVTLYPEAATGYALEAAARMMLGQRDRTRAALRRALAARWEEDADSERRAVKGYLRALEAAGPGH